MIKIALAEDSDLLREAIADLVRKNGFAMTVLASNGKELLEKLEKQTIDIVLMDISMPEMDGIQATDWLKHNRKEIKVIALTMMNDDPTILRMLQAGARGFVMKHTSPESLFRAINEVHETGFHLAGAHINELVQKMTGAEESKPVWTHYVPALTDKEIELIGYLCTGMTQREIGDRFFVSPRSVERLTTEVAKKLGVKSRVQIMLYAIKNGLVRM